MTSREARPAVPWSRIEAAALALVLLVSIGLRAPLAREPLWVDELHTGWVVTHGLDDLPAHARAGNQSPLWFYLPWLSTRLAENAFCLRLPSLLAGIALPLLIYGAARRLLGSPPAALLAALLAALDPQFAFYATEARGYSWVQALAVLHLTAWLTGHADQFSTRQRILWIATGVALFYLHYTTALILAAELAWDTLTLLTRPSSPGTTRRAIDYLLVALSCLPTIPHLRSIAGHRTDWSQALTADSAWTLFPWYSHLLAPLILGLVLTAWRWKSGRQPVCWLPRARLVAGLGVWIVGPWLIALICTSTDTAQLLRYRYLIASATALPLIAALAFVSLPESVSRLSLATLVVILAGYHHVPFRQWLSTGSWPLERSEFWELAVDRLNAAPRSDTPVLLCPALVEDRRLARTPSAAEPPESLVDFCRFPLDSLYRLTTPASRVHPLATLERPRLSTVVRDQITAARGARLVVRGDAELARHIVRELAWELAAAQRTVAARPATTLGQVTIVELQISTAARPVAGPPPPPKKTAPSEELAPTEKPGR
ncbi:MAG: glycosyltransferase family 39 protein [Pirellulales bacterium]